MAIHVDPRTRGGSAALQLGAWVLRAVVWGIAHSCRYRIVDGGEHLEELLARSRPVVLAFWHNRSFLAAPFVPRRLHRRGLEVLALASQSRDGELVARLARFWGLRTVRGSASRGGRDALRAIYRAMVRHGASPVMIPDGPRGPAYRFKVGTVVLAQLSEAPLVPLGFAARRAAAIGSWDRLLVPWPLTTVAVVVGAPQTVPRELAGADLEAERRRLEGVLAAVTARAERAVGAPDPLASGG